MLGHRRVTPSIKFASANLYTWVERGTESKVACPRTQHNVSGQGSNPDHSIWRQAHQPWGHRATHCKNRTITDKFCFENGKLYVDRGCTVLYPVYLAKLSWVYIFSSSDTNQWLAWRSPGQPSPDWQAWWSRQAAQAVWGVCSPPWLVVPLGQVLYQSCVLPGGSILPVWTGQQAWSRNELCTAIDCVNYQVVTLWLPRVHRHLLRSWSVLGSWKYQKLAILHWCESSTCVLMFVLCWMFCCECWYCRVCASVVTCKTYISLLFLLVSISRKVCAKACL